MMTNLMNDGCEERRRRFLVKEGSSDSERVKEKRTTAGKNEGSKTNVEDKSSALCTLVFLGFDENVKNTLVFF
jgi:hypothetical protein